MSCKKHPCDLSGSVGVCASCLRERLLCLIAAQAQAHAHQHPQLARPDDTRINSDAQPPPLMFPRSVSPYVARRKLDDTSWSHHLPFYSTPHIGPTYNSSFPTTYGSSNTYKTKHAKFSLLSNLFRSRSEKFNTDPASVVPSRNSSDASSSSPSWFSTMFSTRRRKQSAPEFSAVIGHKPRRTIDRGMSPARGADLEDDYEYRDRSPSGSGSSSESMQWWKRTPGGSAVVRRGKPGHAKNVSGLAFCLSPLVRPSPNRLQCKKKGGLPPDGEVKIPEKPHLSTAASFCANRSRKLCDFGRVNHNR